MQPDLGGDDSICGAMLFNGDLNDVQCEERTFFICENNFANHLAKAWEIYKKLKKLFILRVLLSDGLFNMYSK